MRDWRDRSQLLHKQRIVWQEFTVSLSSVTEGESSSVNHFFSKVDIVPLIMEEKVCIQLLFYEDLFIKDGAIMNAMLLRVRRTTGINNIQCACGRGHKTNPLWPNFRAHGVNEYHPHECMEELKWFVCQWVCKSFNCKPLPAFCRTNNLSAHKQQRVLLAISTI